MALSIKDAEADRLARAVARATGETLTTAVVTALRERLERVQKPRRTKLLDDLTEISQRCAALPVLDSRSDDGILGYDADGLPS